MVGLTYREGTEEQVERVVVGEVEADEWEGEALLAAARETLINR